MKKNEDSCAGRSHCRQIEKNVRHQDIRHFIIPERIAEVSVISRKGHIVYGRGRAADRKNPLQRQTSVPVRDPVKYAHPDQKESGGRKKRNRDIKERIVIGKRRDEFLRTCRDDTRRDMTAEKQRQEKTAETEPNRVRLHLPPARPVGMPRCDALRHPEFIRHPEERHHKPDADDGSDNPAFRNIVVKEEAIDCQRRTAHGKEHRQHLSRMF